MQALQRVHISRSIGFSCRHSSSNAPSQPDRLVTLPDHTGYLRSSGSSPPPCVISTETSSWPARRSAQSSAAAAGPMISTWPCDLNSTAGAGSGSGSAAMASSAAIFGVDFSADHPASSRTFTKRIGFSASSENSAASCVQATMTSSVPPSAAWNAPASLRHSSWCTWSGASVFSAAASAVASSVTGRLQLQTLSVLPWKLIVLGRFGGLLGLRRLFFFLLVLIAEQMRARLVQGLHQLIRDRLGDRPVARERLERVRRIEMRVGEQFFQRHAPQRVLDLRMHEAGEVGLGGELVRRRQLRSVGLGFLRKLLLFAALFALQPRPAAEEGLVLVRHRYTRSLGCTNERGLMRFCGCGR